MKGSLSSTERKKALIAQNAELRREISQNLDEIEGGVHQILGWVESGVQAGQKLKKGGVWLAGLGGVLLGWRLLRGEKTPSPSSYEPRKRSLLGSLLGGSLRAAGLAGTAIKLWRNWSAVRHHFQAPEKEEQRGEGHEGVTPRF